MVGDRTFPSARQAAHAIGVRPATISKAALSGKLWRGMVVRYLDEGERS